MPTKFNSETPIRVSEVQRVREVYKYLPPFAAPLIPPPKQNDKNAKGSTISPKAFSSSDRALNAFAQLGALRLKARRAMISLVDRTHEYILAESTRTLSSQNDDVHDDGDSLWLGVRTIPREDSLCAAVINTPRSESKRSDTEFRPKAIPKIINDLADDETLKYDHNIIGGPKIRFVATVPIRSRRGFDIGAYSVFDGTPRNGLLPEELEFLTDIADTVMEHLENIVVKRDHQRGEKMVKGLGLFVEGHSSIKSWWLRTRNERQTSVRGRGPYTARSAGDITYPTEATNGNSGTASPEANLSYTEQLQEMDGRTSPLPTSSSPSSNLRNDMPLRPRGENDESHNDLSVRVRDFTSSFQEKLDQPSAPDSPNVPSQVPVSLSNQTSKTRSSTSPDLAHFSTTTKETPTNDSETRTVSNDGEILRRMLSRASNLIRESTDVDGVIFFNAKESAFGPRGHQSSLIGPEKSAGLHNAARVSSSEDNSITSSRNNNSDSSKGKDSDRGSNKAPSPRTCLCEVLAYSTASLSTLHGDSNMPEHLSVQESFVRRLLKRYPHGKIFAFDEEGHMSSSEDEMHDAVSSGKISVVAETSQTPLLKRASSRALEGQTMLQVFPGARHIMVLPLWDSHRERWFASAMLWTSDPTRVLSLDDDLNYVAAFGNSIMAEVSRLDIVASDQTKTALISSISHELRSPLQGIQGSIELLQDTHISKFQKNALETIGHCSNTLLDTLTNVLDYAKINNFTTAQKVENRVIRNSSKIRKAVPAEKFQVYGTISLTSDLDIASITEDVINGIYAGHVHVLHVTSFDGSTDIDQPISPTKSDMKGMEEPQSLSVILDVDHKSNWTFLTQPGAWKRILMNIFGNALKYTTSGVIQVSLGYKSTTTRKSRMNQEFITLIISDTGRGIGEDFLKRQIYTPFAQEDSLTPGAGLGLSIVRQIVGALDGKIEVFSIQGTGTVVKVVLKLEKSQSQAGEIPHMPNNVQQAKTYTHGLQLVLIGMEISTSEPDQKTNGEPNYGRSVGPAISRMSRNWFGMKTSEASGFDAAIGDIFMITSEKFDVLESSWKNLHSETTGDTRKRHVIVLTGSAQSERRTLHESHQNIHFLSNPIGPKKLADCFLSIFDRSSSQDSNHFLAMPPNPRRRTSPFFRKDSPEPNHNQSIVETTKPTALLVEDNAINMKILIACMKKLNVQYSCAINGKDAVTQYTNAKRKPDIVFMDISMPVMNGFEASQLIRGMERKEGWKATVIVAVTGLASDESQREAYSCGINLFMSKPVPLKELGKIVGGLERGRRVSAG
ncbi:putative sensor histidine kinase response protein [Botrytis fragariae]|uniref:Putative sensor histidine kinase response protein n=1 Tax=Botrytis fragariae TaxID=1964551 RepID=A0A8H6AWH1_9HELO|nr:putative sensor histidine kinase response protein [Botrytis fragariae]KAF5874675.1 putative sensor histidine kinase response protein [Botrytis fragariae]